MLIKQNVNTLVEDNTKDYYKEILVNRAIPDIRDGLKPIQRKILWDMYDEHIKSSGSFVKSAKVVGSVIAKYSPHGDSSAYDAMVGMVKTWQNNQILLTPHGNFGNVYGDGASAYRYSEIKLNKFSEEVYLDNLNDNSVDFVSNFDNTLNEPSILPAKLPMILINGAFGIGGGYLVSIPTHNMSDVIKATISLIDDPEISVEEFAKSIKPDFPTGGIIINPKDIELSYADQKNAIKNKKSNIIIRSKIIQEKNSLIITEIPFMKSLNTILDSIRSAVKEKKIDGIKNIKDLSSKGDIKVIIECYKDVDLDIIEKQLYAYTDVQNTIPLILIGVVNEKFVIFDNLKEIFTKWIEFRKDTIKRIKMETIRKHSYRIHILEGLIKVLDNKNIDTLIKIVKSGKSKEDIMQTLIKTFDLTDIQSKYIIELQLYRINRLQVQELIDEKNDLNKKVKEEIDFFYNEDKIFSYIKKELIELSKKYSTTHKTKVVYNVVESKSEPIIPDEDYTIILSNKYIKKLKLDVSSQNKGGKGKSIGKMQEDDYLKKIIQCNSRDNLLFFVKSGVVFSSKVYEIEESKTTRLGINVNPYIGGNNKEDLVNIISVNDNDFSNENKYLLITTNMGKIKFVKLNEFAKINKSGLIASKILDGDFIISADIVDITKDFTVISILDNGTALRFNKEGIPIIGRTTFGNDIFKKKIITNGNRVVNSLILHDSDKEIFIISKNGIGKRLEIKDIPIHSIHTMGVLITKLKGNDKLVRGIVTDADKEIIIISSSNIINIKSSDISLLKRPAYGNIIKSLNKNEEIIDCCV